MTAFTRMEQYLDEKMEKTPHDHAVKCKNLSTVLERIFTNPLAIESYTLPWSRADLSISRYPRRLRELCQELKLMCTEHTKTRWPDENIFKRNMIQVLKPILNKHLEALAKDELLTSRYDDDPEKRLTFFAENNTGLSESLTNPMVMDNRTFCRLFATGKQLKDTLSEPHLHRKNKEKDRLIREIEVMLSHCFMKHYLVSDPARRTIQNCCQDIKTEMETLLDGKMANSSYDEDIAQLRLKSVEFLPKLCGIYKCVKILSKDASIERSDHMYAISRAPQ